MNVYFDNKCDFSDARGQNVRNPQLINQMKSYNQIGPKKILAKGGKGIRTLQEGELFLNMK